MEDNFNFEMPSIEEYLKTSYKTVGFGTFGAKGIDVLSETKAAEALLVKAGDMADVAALADNDTRMTVIVTDVEDADSYALAVDFAKVCKDAGILTVGIVAMPDSVDRMDMPVVAERLKDNLDSIIILKKAPDGDDAKALGLVSMAVNGLLDIITSEGYISLDFTDLCAVLRDGGLTFVSEGYGEGKERTTKAIHESLEMAALNDADVFACRKFIFTLSFSREADDTYRIDETNEISTFIEALNHDVDVIWGVSFDETLGNKVKFSLIATGMR